MEFSNLRYNIIMNITKKTETTIIPEITTTTVISGVITTSAAIASAAVTIAII